MRTALVAGGVLAQRLARSCGRLYAGGMRGGGTVTVATAAVAAIVTVAVALLPQLHFAYRQPLLHVALETAASLIALLSGFLVFGRLRRTRMLNELLLACALALLAPLNLLYVMTPALVPRDLMTFAALIGSLLSAALFVLAAFAPRAKLRRPGYALAAASAATLVVLVAAVLASEITGRVSRVAAGLPRDPSLRIDLYAQPTVPVLHLLIMLMYGLAAFGFLRRSRRFGDEFFGWLAIAAVLAAASHLNYFLYPSLYGQWVHTGDIFRLCFYAVLLTGSMREIWSYWQALSQAAVSEERRRIARDLHDGLAQELTYLARNLDSLDVSSADGTLQRLRRAVERAQLESRRAVTALAAPVGQSLESALAEAVGEVAERFHVGLDLDLATGLRLPAARAEALVRIACEAVANAARHSGASRVRLSLERDGLRARLRVSDRGRGFEPTAPAGGFGLVSMRERAHSVGGELRITSAPGHGSKVEAAF
jgi:signal transduction histidine kinase